MYELAGRVKYQIERGKEVIILYFGDHDPSGLDMIRDIRERTEEFLTKGMLQVTPDFRIIPVSLSTEQIEKYAPPPNPAKITDPRAKWYIKQFGAVSWELDAIDAMELRQLAEDAIRQFLDVPKYNKWIRREKAEITALREFGEDYERDS